MDLLVGTTNRGKVTEIGHALDGLPVRLLTLADHPPVAGLPPPDETGETFLENALQKLAYYGSRAGMPTLAEDSGILVDALAGELGIHTRRWGAGPEASDEEWIAFFLERMHHEPNKRARFVCAMAYVDPAGETHTFEGVCDGIITETLEATYLPGLPISACFRADGTEAVYSALPIEQKNRTSHRGRAAGKLRAHLERTLRA